MRRSDFPVQSSVLVPDALVERVLPSYALPEPRRCRLISRSANDTYLITAGAGTWYLRITGHGWRPREALSAELALVADLGRRGLNVAPAVPRVDGQLLTPLSAPEGERFAILFAPAAGQPVADIAPQQARAYGRLAAALHMATDAAPTVYRRFHIDECHLLDEPLAAVRRAGIDGGEDLMFLERTAERVRRCLAGLPRSSPAYGLCHGDLHPGNICIDSEGQPTLFDFDFVWYGWRAYDLTVFLWNAYGERRSQRWRDSRWRAFLHGYREVQPLPEGLEEMVPLFLVARQIWLMGLDCADRSGMPPQWLTPGWLRETVRPMRDWVAAYPILSG